MKIKILTILLIIFFAGCSIKTETSGEYIISVVSFNVCCKNTQYGNTVSKRAPLLLEILKNYNPDIMGFQEYDLNWEQNISKNLNEEYDKIFKPRSRTETECTPIFYKKDKFELLDQGYFWLSDTPEKQSKSWNAEKYRICSWARLKIKDTNKTFFAFNTHFDFNKTSQIESAELMKRKILQIADNSPVIISGDFNMTQNSAGYEKMTGFLKDANVEKDTTPTFRVFDGSVASPIDFIFVTENVTPLKYTVINNNIKGKFPSDHFGIYTELIIR